MKLSPNLNEVKIKVCSRCIYDERVPSISFDSDGVCNYCHDISRLKALYGTGEARGQTTFRRIVSEIKASNAQGPYDCVVGVSGGTDSSYLVHLAKEEGLRPLAVHYDNTWNSAIATGNIERVLRGLDVDLHTHVVSNREADDLARAFFLAGVAEIEAPTDLAYAYVLRQAAAKFSIKFVLEGHSFMEEGITPLGRNYFDGRYIQSIHKRFGSVPLQSYPLMTFSRFLKSVLFDRVRFVRPLWYVNYSKSQARQLLGERYGWKDYGGHHLENRLTAFYHSVYLPSKFGQDMRNNSLSAQVRNGALSREDAWAQYISPPCINAELITYFKKRLRLDDRMYESMMSEVPKSWWQYPTYKKRFEVFRPLFRHLAARELVPMSFYLKYCLSVSESA